MLPEFAVHHRLSVGFLAVTLCLAGLFSGWTIGRLEDPEFTIKTGVVLTFCPGASAREIERNVTEHVERACRRLQEIEHLRSHSEPGLSLIYADLKQDIPSSALPAVWTDLRNKLSDLQGELPPEALPPIVQDDFGQVYGIVLALSGDGFPPADRLVRARELQREFSRLREAGRVELWGIPEEQIEIRISQARLARLSISPASLLRALAGQDLTMDSGSLKFGGNEIRFTPSGRFTTIREIEDLVLSADPALTKFQNLTDPGVSPIGTVPDHPAQLSALFFHAGGIPQGVLHQQKIRSAGNSVSGTVSQYRLGDIASVERVLKVPPSRLFRFNGKDAIAIAISPRANGNVVQLGREVKDCAARIMAHFPTGYSLQEVSFQPDDVEKAVALFLKNLREAVLIVTFVVMFSMGWRSGLLISSSLLLVILTTMCVLEPLGIVFQRISLGAFIIALGILVDDAVVVGDLIIVRMQRGMERRRACIEGAQRASRQLLGATIVGALAFLPIYLTPTNVGEYCASLFLVVAVSLGVSWLVAMLQTPLVYSLFVKISPEKTAKDPHSGPVYQVYRNALAWTLRHRTAVILSAVFACGLAAWEFRNIDQNFFPRAQRNQFWIDFRFPAGTSIETVSEEMKKAESFLLKQEWKTAENIVSAASFIGAGPPRFYLPYQPEFPHPNYGHMVVNVRKAEDVDSLLAPVRFWMKENFPQAQVRVQRYAMGLPTPNEVEIRFRGPDHAKLQLLALKAEAILRNSSNALDVQNNWREKQLTLVPQYSQMKGQDAGMSRLTVQNSLRTRTRGIPVGNFAEKEQNLPILLRGAISEQNETESLSGTLIWGAFPGSIPLGNLISGMEFLWEDSSIYRYDGSPAVVVGADAYGTSWMELLRKIRPQMESIVLPEGFSMEWGGQFHESQEAARDVLANLPTAAVLMLLVVVFLFNDLRQPLIIVLTVPLAMIGITGGLLLMQKPFGFMALLGVMSLLGMIVRNGVVLMDQIDEEVGKGGSAFLAVLNASVERMRPVTVAAATVIVGMIPLLRDPMFDAMATAMMFGLIFSTLLTLFIVPVLYSIFFRIPIPKRTKRGSSGPSSSSDTA